MLVLHGVEKVPRGTPVPTLCVVHGIIQHALK
jgi:hypothetical protein